MRVLLGAMRRSSCSTARAGIDPLKPAYDVAKAVFLFYERDDLSWREPAARKGCSSAIRAICRPSCGSAKFEYFNGGRQADGIRYCEQALAIDPLLEAARRISSRGYLDLDDSAAAQQVIDQSRGEAAVPRTMIALHQRDWSARRRGRL